MNDATPVAAGDRRPLRTRSARWAQALARALARRGVRPNVISAASMAFAALAAVLAFAGIDDDAPLAFLAAAACVQLRLLCNMIDGMVGVEGGLGTKSGDVWNELPDRVADVLILAGAGHAVGGEAGPVLGWACSVAAVLTAYVRAFGVAKGVPADFGGPMAKPHRMAAMTVAFVVLAFVEAHARPYWLAAVLAAILALTLLTVALRTRRLVRRLESG